MPAETNHRPHGAVNEEKRADRRAAIANAHRARLVAQQQAFQERTAKMAVEQKRRFQKRHGLTPSAVTGAPEKAVADSKTAVIEQVFAANGEGSELQTRLAAMFANHQSYDDIDAYRQRLIDLRGGEGALRPEDHELLENMADAIVAAQAKHVEV